MQKFRFENVDSVGFEYIVDGLMADHESSSERSNAFFVLGVRSPNGLTMMRQEFGAFVDVHYSILVDYCKQR